MENEKNIDSFYEFFNAHYETQHQESIQRLVSIKAGVPELGRRLPIMEMDVANQIKTRHFYFSGRIRLVSFYKLGNKISLSPEAAFDVNNPYFDYSGWERMFIRREKNNV